VIGRCVCFLPESLPPSVSKDPMRQTQCTLSINWCNRSLTMIDEPLRDYRDATFSERLRLTRPRPWRIARTSRWRG
jgi:hypothetical protein